ncbi:SDR family NAD(P)-dependent oxidoreductase [Methylobacterium isbiliense]|jgi:NAD(P)-dependent dehydrogenase (short-subunit alcohol dehydrogenase family)|uniref:3-oxoacyl-[acyl-carrier-protein] reductase FabG n=1 Tax=Methylobacterium isbiliense TaxID=315478 RepID=A0ABQ4SAA5_9HYPH|nr:SDR family oxidoreductase [Methylobacterium isbiliense]MDN3623354.1 SDR family oxidoreductase [Methylobacterium isbiliense]GJE00090.1 3-oxoacyl-[acyl-carrier-protein] reductase FabG [Methylobacterium isbiliense]
MDLAAGLRGRHVLVTGASSGLGDHFARLCARCGAAVTVAARRKERLDALVAALREAGAPEARALALDVADADSVAGAFADLAGALPDVVVNNAGIAEGGAALDTDLDTFDRVIATNLRGVWAMSTAAARAWRAAGRGGTIVNVASILGLRVTGGVGPYTVSKAGVVQMTQALGLEWARHGIRVNALAPGYVGTDINRDFFESPPGQAMIKRIPMRRLGRPEDLDGAFLLLAGDASGWMTGATIPVDGGHLVSGL